MQIVFVGSVYPRERENEIRKNSKDGTANAANNLQWALLTGLDHFYPDFKIITQPSIGTYPLNYKKIYFNGSCFSHKSNSIDYCLGFINIPLIKHVYKEIKLYHKLNKIINNKLKTTIIIYGIHSPFLKAAVKLKKINCNINICLIAPDLPQFMSSSKNPFYRFFKFLDSIIINNCLKHIDSFVLLTDDMAEILKVNSRPWTRIEGIFNNTNDSKIHDKEIHKTIFYSGTLDKRYGILNLIKAFMHIKSDDYRLWICGDGDTRKEIERIASVDKRILYLGNKSHTEILLLQKRATILINPRTSEGVYTKYSFPSKTMEYLASGTPTLLYRLKGIPDEYYQYCHVIEEENVDGLRKAILFVCEKEKLELDELGNKATKFILENKNPIQQVSKIYEMLK